MNFTPWSGESVAGVYALMDGDSILYIGQSANISARVAGHRSKGRLFSSVSFIRIPGRANRLRVESELIRKHKPPQNQITGGLTEILKIRCEAELKDLVMARSAKCGMRWQDYVRRMLADATEKLLPEQPPTHPA